jgi:type II secretory pathway pseudopilin PulG
MNNIKHKNLKTFFGGFSLIELALVLTIIAMITGALISLAGNKITDSEIESTRKKIDVIEMLLQNYVNNYGYLPCPANITETSANANFGVGVGSGTGDCSTSGASLSGTNVYYGLFPFASFDEELDSSITYDSWGNRILYAVDQRYTKADNDSTTTNTTINFGQTNALSGDSDLILKNTIGSGSFIVEGPDLGSPTESKKLAYVLVSYGPNGFHGRLAKAPNTQNPASSDADEGENGNNDAIFVQKLNNLDFDDIVRYKTRWQLE